MARVDGARHDDIQNAISAQRDPADGWQPHETSQGGLWSVENTMEMGFKMEKYRKWN